MEVAREVVGIFASDAEPHDRAPTSSLPGGPGPTRTRRGEVTGQTNRQYRFPIRGVQHNAAVAIHRSAQFFDAAADDYERARPDYPDQALAWLADRLGLRPGRTVLDLAAGTGKLTRLLVRTGARVVAVEPVAGMRARLTGSLPDEDVLDGSAEDLPLTAGSVDAATVAQAFHWFDGDRALSEIHRVTRPGSRLAVVYNRRPLDHPLQAAIEAIFAPHRGDTPSQATGLWREAFDRSRLWAPRRGAP